MIPENRLSTTVLSAPIIGARRNTTNDIVDYEDGGIYLNDPSAGLMYQEWICRTNGSNVTLESATTIPTVIYSGTAITHICCSFDQNMAFALAFIEGGQSKFMWYDATISGYTTTNINGKFPRVFLDDKRPEVIAVSDLILAYIREELVGVDLRMRLYFRMQRDRYLIEYLLHDDLYLLFPDFPFDGSINFKNFGMGSNLRLQFLFVVDIVGECVTFDKFDPYEVSDLV